MIEFYNDCTINRSNGEKLTIMYRPYAFYCAFESDCAFENKDVFIKKFDFDFFFNFLFYQENLRKSQDDLQIFIENHCEAIIYQRVVKAGDTYYLDIMTTEDSSPLDLNVKHAQRILKPRVAIYKPIIEYFLLHGFDKLFNAGCPKSLLNLEKTEPTFLNKITKGTWYVSFNKKEKSRNPFKGWNWIFVNGKQTDHILIPSEVVDTFHNINAGNQQQGTIYITKEGMPHRYATPGRNYTYKDGLFKGVYFVDSKYL